MTQNKNSVISVNDESENVRVAVRVRPLNKKELKEDVGNIASINEDNNVISLGKPGLPDEAPKSFKFDYIFPESCTQMDLYKHIAYPIVEKVFEGYNGTIFAYGQTGTGKTYTMIGEQNDPEQKGIIPNTFHHIFNKILSCDSSKSAIATVSYLEIYNEDVRDLLSPNPNAKLEVRERLDIGVYVKDLREFPVDSIQGITELMNKGNANRFTRSTLMNDISSRSHAIFTMTIECKDKTNNQTTIGKLNLVDLAGSERLGRTNATGDRLKEASNINQSLSVLGTVISALINAKSTHIPYRNSKLTRLLQDSLGGNSKTAMIAMISPSENDYEESICTLRYASRAKCIKNQIRATVKTQKNMITCFEQEISRLLILIVSLREENAILLKRNKDREFGSFYGDHKRHDEEFQQPENVENREENFDEVKLNGDFVFDDDDEQIEDDVNEMEPATKRFCEFLIKQTPENTFFNFLKSYAKQQLASEYAQRNYRLYNMTLNQNNTQDNDRSINISERSISMPNLAKIEKFATVCKYKSLNCINEGAPDEFFEIHSIKLDLKNLQSILMQRNDDGEDEQMEISRSFEHHNETHFNLSVNSLQTQNEDVYKRYTEISELRNNLLNKSEESARLKETNHLLELEVEKYKKNAEANNKLQDHIVELTSKLNMIDDTLIKYQCESDIMREREKQLIESCGNKDVQIQKLKDELERQSKNLKRKDISIQSITNEKKALGDKLSLLNVKVKYLESNIGDIRNQNNQLYNCRKNHEKEIEEYRREMLKVKNAQSEFKRQASQQLKRLNDLMYQNEMLIARNNSLTVDLNNVTKNMNCEVALRNELELKLKTKEEARKAIELDFINLKQILKLNRLYKSPIATSRELEEKLKPSNGDNKNARETLCRCNVKNIKSPYKFDSNEEMRNFKNTHLTDEDIHIKTILKKAEETKECLQERDKQIVSLKVLLSEANARIANTQKELEFTRSSCECKINAVRTSLANRRRLEKNILQDSKRNLSNEDIQDNQRVKTDIFPLKNEIETKKDKDNQSSPNENLEIPLQQKYEILKCIARRRLIEITGLKKQLGLQSTD